MRKVRDKSCRCSLVPAVAPVAMENQVANPTQQNRVWYTLRLSPGTGVEKWYKCWWLLLSSRHHQREKKQSCRHMHLCPPHPPAAYPTPADPATEESVCKGQKQHSRQSGLYSLQQNSVEKTKLQMLEPASHWLPLFHLPQWNSTEAAGISQIVKYGYLQVASGFR